MSATHYGVLRECVRAGLGTAVPPRVSSDVDVAGLLAAADAHGLAPSLRFSDTAGMTAEARAAIESHVAAVAARGLAIAAELFTLQDQLRDHGVEVAAFKGPALAQLLYGDAGRRQFADIDLLIHSSDIPRAIRIMTDLGYRSYPRVGVDLLPRYIRVASDWAMVGGSGVWIELHWALAPAYFSVAIDAGDLLRTSVEVPIGGRPVRTLSPEAYLLALCVHGGKHLWERLGWVADVAALVQRCPEMDWERVGEHARALGAGRLLAVGLALARQELLGALPAPAARLVGADPRAMPLAATMVRRMRRVDGRAGGEPAAFDRLNLALRERARDRVRYVARLVVEPNWLDLQAVTLPAWLSGGYYLVRMARVSLTYGRRMMAAPGFTNRRGGSAA